MKEELTKVELLQLSEATIDKMKARGYRMLFLMFAIVCALVASVGVARALGIKSADLDTLSSGIMFANSFVVYTGIKNVRRNRIAIETFEEGIAEFKNGEISEEDFYREWLEGVWIFIDSNYNEIKRMADKKSESGGQVPMVSR